MLSKFHHITVMVKDIEKAEEFYSSVGIGPFESAHGIACPDKKLRGKPLGRVKLVARETHIGPIVLQLVQHFEGECIQKDFVEANGQGVQHLGWEVDDVNKTEAKMAGLGIKASQTGRREDGSGYTFFDTEEQAGVVLEIKQDPSTAG